MSLSFVVFGLLVTSVGYSVGLVLLVPRANAVFATATAGFAARADSGLDSVDRTFLATLPAAALLPGDIR